MYRITDSSYARQATPLASLRLQPTILDTTGAGVLILGTPGSLPDLDPGAGHVELQRRSS